MKKHLVNLLFTLLLSSFIYAQEIIEVPNNPTPQDYLKKSKTQRTAGLICLGITGAIIGIAAPGNVSLDALPALVVLGLAAGVSSITLFIASGKNKRKANLKVSQQTTSTGLPKHLRLINSLTLKISLSK